VPNLARSKLPLLLSQRLRNIPRMRTFRPLQIAVQLSLIYLAFLLALPKGYAGSATWNLNPTSSDWNTAANWMPNTVPNGPADTATFAVSNLTGISISAGTEVNTIVFDPGANAFTITAGQFFTLNISGGITNNSAVTQNFVADTDASGQFGIIRFDSNATVGTSIIFTNKGSQVIANGGDTFFAGNSSAGNGTFINNPPSAPLGGAGLTSFGEGATAGSGIIINNGGGFTGATGGGTIFFATTTASNATLIANGGTNGGNGGVIAFEERSTGDIARVEVFGNGSLDLSLHKPPGVTVGSLEGDGNVLLGSNNLTVGANNLSTTFNGVIQNNGSLTKTGTGTLTLSGANTYSRNTTVSQGVLLVGNTSGSATGTGTVIVNVGTFGGSGIISGPATVGMGSGAGALLAPAFGSKKQVTLTLERSLTLQADATYIYTFKARSNQVRTDVVVAKGVTITGATIKLKGKIQGTLAPGTVLTVISNTSANPITGTFSNLADGAIVTVNGNNLQASYTGGDGNDLTLTVVP
jgi:autotransporter-associated beta strand protein